MKIIESNPRGPLSEERLEEFEEFLGTILPEDYRKFLLRHNGPIVEPTSFGSSEGEELSSIEGCFYGLVAAEEYDLEKVFMENRDELPDGCLAIACDGCGNEVCLALTEKEMGKIYFYNHEADDHETAVGDMELVADTFDEFLQGLHEYQDVQSEESTASSSLFGIFVKAFIHEGNPPSALLGGQKLDAYLMKGRNKDMSKIPGDVAIPLLDAIVKDAKEIGPASKDFLHGSVRDSLEFYLPGNHQLSVGITDEKHLICQGGYWETGEDAWKLILQLQTTDDRV
jgi:SMI1 / KNR4 family (SUKH-1)